jgi:hypothetical protein
MIIDEKLNFTQQIVLMRGGVNGTLYSIFVYVRKGTEKV